MKSLSLFKRTAAVALSALTLASAFAPLTAAAADTNTKYHAGDVVTVSVAFGGVKVNGSAAKIASYNYTLSYNSSSAEYQKYSAREEGSGHIIMVDGNTPGEVNIGAMNADGFASDYSGSVKTSVALTLSVKKDTNDLGITGVCSALTALSSKDILTVLVESTKPEKKDVYSSFIIASGDIDPFTDPTPADSDTENNSDSDTQPAAADLTKKYHPGDIVTVDLFLKNVKLNNKAALLSSVNYELSYNNTAAVIENTEFACSDGTTMISKNKMPAKIAGMNADGFSANYSGSRNLFCTVTFKVTANTNDLKISGKLVALSAVDRDGENLTALVDGKNTTDNYTELKTSVSCDHAAATDSEKPTTDSEKPDVSTSSDKPNSTTDSEKPKPTTDSEKPKPTTDSEKPKPTTDSEKPKPTATDTEKYKPTSTDTEKSKPTATDTEKSKPTSTDTEKSKPTATDTEKSKPTSTDTEKSKPTSTDTEKSKPISTDSDKNTPVKPTDTDNTSDTTDTDKNTSKTTDSDKTNVTTDSDKPVFTDNTDSEAPAPADNTDSETPAPADNTDSETPAPADNTDSETPAPADNTDTEKPVSTDTTDTEKPADDKKNTPDTPATSDQPEKPDEGKEIISGDVGYKVNDDGTAVITKFVTNDKEVTIPKEIDGKKVTRIDANAFRENPNVESVIIADNISEIGDGAFENCQNLKEAVIGENVTSISETAFAGCPGMLIFGAKGSYAEQYAAEHGIDFVNKDNLYGDVDEDDAVTSGDSLMILRASIGLGEFTKAQQIYADSNTDEIVDSADALQTLRFSVTLPANENIGKPVR